MKIIFVNRYFFPDNSATSQILTDLAFYLADNGYDIHVVTSRCNYTDNTIEYDDKEVNNNLTIHRIWTTRFGRSNLVGRTVDYFSFYVSSLFKLMYLVKKSDLVVAKTDPPMISIVIHFVCLIKRSKYINWLQDLFPEIGESLGVSVLSGKFGEIVKFIRNVSLKSAYLNVVIGEKMGELLNAEGIGRDKITVIHNWSDIDIDTKNKNNVLELSKEWKVEGKFVIGYSGNFGRAHEYHTIADVISKMRDDADVLFLFIGGGIYYDKLKQFVDKENIKNVEFKPYQPRENLVDSLSLPDVHLVSLVSSLEGLIVPSKYYGIAAVGKPAIFIGDTEGEIAAILQKYNCGLVIEPGSTDLLIDAIYKLKSNAEMLKLYSNNAYDVYKNTYTKKIALTKWEHLISDSISS